MCNHENNVLSHVFSWLDLYIRSNILLLWDLSTLCVVDHLWPFIWPHTYITYIVLYYMLYVSHIYHILSHTLLLYCYYKYITYYIYYIFNDVHPWRLFRSNYRKLAWVGIEPMNAEFRLDPQWLGSQAIGSTYTHR